MPALILAAFLLLSVFAALPAYAVEIKESCTLSRDIKVDNVKILKGSTVKEGTTLVKDLTTTETAAVGTFSIKEWGTICLVNTVNAVTDWLFFILISIAFIFILIAGFLWMTGRGEAEKQKQAANMIAAALVGIVIAILARIIPAVLIGILA
jgi:Flp pilus assembly protein TadB